MIYEKLFLNINEDHYIQEKWTTKLNEHGKNGLRFLYEQFQNKSPGVIMNRAKNAKNVEVALFLNAIKQNLRQPILILSNDIQEWEQIFYEWTDNVNDIAFGTQKFSTDKKIFVNSCDDVNLVLRKDWSVLVVENEEGISKVLRKLKKVKADFKIVICSTDFKINIHTFGEMNEWLNPKDKLNTDNFITAWNKLNNNLDKAIQLDCYLEGIVWNASESYHEYNRYQIHPNNEQSTTKVSRKNKDPTGKKVKRSKKSNDTDNCMALNMNIEMKDRTNNAGDSIKDSESTKTAIKRPMNVETDNDSYGENNDLITKKRKQMEIEGDASNDEIKYSDNSINKIETSKEDITLSYKTLVNETLDKEDSTNNSITENSENVVISKDDATQLESGSSHKNVEKYSSETKKNPAGTAVIDNDLNEEDMKRLNISVLDNKLKCLEETTIKKFKGSLLDSIF